jgi:hypothetical protein
MVRKVLWRVSFPDDVEHIQELANGSRPAMIESDRNGVRFLREESEELKLDSIVFSVLDRGLEVWKTIDAIFVLSPVEFVQPVFFSLFQVISGHTKSSPAVGILKDCRTDRRKLEKVLEMLQLFFICTMVSLLIDPYYILALPTDMSFERLDVKRCSRWNFGEIGHDEELFSNILPKYRLEDR